MEFQSLAGIENIADESEGGRDHLEVLKEIAADLPLSKKERDLLSALLRGEKAADVRKTMNMSRASYYRLRARLIAALRKEKDRFWDMVK